MRIVVTGSLGHISKPLVANLVSKGHDITIISSNADKQKAIETLGAVAAIGALEDAYFLTATFKGADAVYTMVPPNNYFNHDLDLTAYYNKLGRNYAQAIKQSGVKKVVNLSSIGAHLEKGSGILIGTHNVEGILNELSGEVEITHLRPTSFYYNLYGYTHMIKNEGIIAANYGADKIVPWVAPADIAAVVAEELLATGNGFKIRYIVSEERTGNEVATILGEAIGKPDLKWVLTTNEESLKGLIAIGMSPTIAAGLVEMYASLYSGLLLEDYYCNKPSTMGSIKMKDFAEEFAAGFKQN